MSVPGDHIAKTCTFPVDMVTSGRYIMRCVSHLAIVPSAESQTQLRKAHPDEEIRPPPAKDRTYVSSRAPLGPTISNTSTSFELAASANRSQDSPSSSPVPTVAPSLRLAREKNRLTLRAYLHALMSSVTIASSPVIKSFLLADPTTLTDEEVEDAQYREEADRTRDEGRKQFAKEVSARVDSLRSLVKGMKGDLLGRGHCCLPRSLKSKSDRPTDGLTRVFAVIKATDNVRGLPPEFKALVEWGRISLVIHHKREGFPLILVFFFFPKNGFYRFSSLHCGR